MFIASVTKRSRTHPTEDITWFANIRKSITFILAQSITMVLSRQYNQTDVT